MKSKIKYLFFLLIGVFLFKWFYGTFSGEDALNLVLDYKYYFHLLIIAHIPTLYFDALTWVVLTKKSNLSVLWSFVIIWISQATGKFFPTGNITAEFVRIYLGIKKGLSPTESSSSVFIDLVIATFSLFLIAFISFIYLVFNYQEIMLDEYITYFIFSLILILFGCITFYLLIRKRFLKVFIQKTKKVSFFKLSFSKIVSLMRIDKALFNFTNDKVILFKALSFRLLGWLGGAFEIYVFLWIIGYEPQIIDVIIIESFSGIIRAIAFFIPAGIGVQELAFIVVGDFVGLSSQISFSIAIGRRIREILVGAPAIVAWLFLNKSFKK